MNVEHELNELFTRYVNAFKQYDMAAALSCYHLPCTLHTPEKIAYLENEEKFKQEFIDIFTILKHAKISKIVADKASYQYCQKHSLDVCINWLFYDENDELFTDFSAFYHIANDESSEGIGKIISVVSHEIQNSIELAQPFKIT
ncbi:hypothetical protein WNY51_02060 [Pseudocolwellia sp. AS88]|uniref:hypothetical protein n=1 Tax=Pseudocolwellia sp. AS88 TaxID=3063958 RepID=UPI0026EB49AE|nr:hypothetical protein [Pseudocolwellia sp. AS88]MDO7084588.1 hypothetical protein [Pseudocolwellia sp. AS88]